jgi:hypothetical protein
MNMTSLIRSMSSIIKGISTGGTKTNTMQETTPLSIYSLYNGWRTRREVELNGRIVYIAGPVSPIVMIYDEKNKTYRLA